MKINAPVSTVNKLNREYRRLKKAKAKASRHQQHKLTSRVKTATRDLYS